MTRLAMGWVAVAAALVCMAAKAGAVTYDWRPGEPVPGVDGAVWATVAWDPDGDGPQPEMLVVGGEFRVAGDVVAKNIAAWDGQRWHALGEGYCHVVWSLAVYEGDLIIGGGYDYEACSAPYVVRFNGSTWEPLADGPDDYVQALAVYDGQLVAAGPFSRAGGQECHGVASWDGSEWHPLGDGIPGGCCPYIRAMLVYDDQLIVAGELHRRAGPMSYIARWDGHSWQPMGERLYPDHEAGLYWVNDLVVYGGDLLASTDSQWDDNSGFQMQGGLFRWDGQEWRPLGGEIDFIPLRMAVFGGRLLASVWFPTGGSAMLSWDGQSWSYESESAVGMAQTMGIYRGDLIVGTYYGGPTISVPCSGIGRWDGQQWHALGRGSNVYPQVVATHDGALIVAETSEGPGYQQACTIVRRDGERRVPLGELSGFEDVNPWVATIGAYNGDMILGGLFVGVDGLTCNGIARWDGREWHALGGGLLGESVNGQVSSGSAHAVVTYNGELIVGGYFHMAGGVASKAVARWDGSQWRAMDAGLTGIYHLFEGEDSPRYYKPSVEALAVYKGQLIVGGLFTTTGGAAGGHLARWDGNRWQPVGGGVSGGEWVCVSALAVYDDQLVVGGCFMQAGDVGCDSVAAWDGERWHAMSSGQGMRIRGGSVYALTVYDGYLIAAGHFSNMPDAEPVPRISQWDGQQWQPLGAGVNDSVYAMTQHDGDLVVCGYFTVAGGHVSARLARWGPQYPGDINGDGRVDLLDLSAMLEAWGASVGDPRYLVAADLDGDGTVSVFDVISLVWALSG